MVKNDPSKPPRWAKFWSSITIFYQTFELEIQPRVGLLLQKKLLKNIVNNSKTKLKKYRKRLFSK